MRARFAVRAAMLAALAGCGGTTEPPPPPPPPPPPVVPVMTSAYILGDSVVRVAEGAPVPYRVMGRFDIRPDSEVTHRCSLRTSPELITFSLVYPGRGVAVKSGATEITAVCGAFSTSRTVDVRLDGDVPRSELMQVPEEVWSFVPGNNFILNDGLPERFVRWAPPPPGVARVKIRVWVQSGVPLDEFMESSRLAETVVSQVIYEEAPDSVSAQLHVVWSSEVPAGLAGMWKVQVSGSTITGAVISFPTDSTRGILALSREERLKTFAHEILHTLGMVGHPRIGCSVINYNCSQYTSSPFVDGYFGLVYSVPPGTRVY